MRDAGNILKNIVLSALEEYGRDVSCKIMFNFLFVSRVGLNLYLTNQIRICRKLGHFVGQSAAI